MTLNTQNIQNFQTFCPYLNLGASATNDLLENYDKFDYQINGVGSTIQSKNAVYNSDSASINYIISVTNNFESDITVTCIKFSKKVQSLQFLGYFLVCGYYLDNPLVIPPTESRTLTIQLKVGFDLQAGEI